METEPFLSNLIYWIIKQMLILTGIHELKIAFFSLIFYAQKIIVVFIILLSVEVLVNQSPGNRGSTVHILKSLPYISTAAIDCQ